MKIIPPPHRKLEYGDNGEFADIEIADNRSFNGELPDFEVIVHTEDTTVNLEMSCQEYVRFKEMMEERLSEVPL